MTGLLRLQYGIFVSKFTQDKLKANPVNLPINESKVMKAHLANWIRERAIIMNDSALLGKDRNTFNLESVECR